MKKTTYVLSLRVKEEILASENHPVAEPVPVGSFAPREDLVLFVEISLKVHLGSIFPQCCGWKDDERKKKRRVKGGKEEKD